MTRFIRKKYEVDDMEEAVTHTLGGHADRGARTGRRDWS